MDVINKTGISTKNKGDGLSSAEFNKINSSINQSIDANNLYLRSIFDVNLELSTLNCYTLAEAIALVPQNRKRSGFRVRFLSSPGFYDEQIFLGDDIENWNDLREWGRGGTIIDGGEF